MKYFSLAATLLLSLSAYASAPVPHWSYEGEGGPEHWSKLSPLYATCHYGQFQSPIDIQHALDAKLPPLQIDFHSSAETIINNGHTVQIIVDDADDFEIDRQNFVLTQFHFHSPSENMIESKQYPLEVHFVHVNKKGELAVLAVMFKVGAENPALLPILQALPNQINRTKKMKEQLDLRPLFPVNKHYYRFSGSLTTPPCSEGLRWLVMSEPVTLSPQQLAQFQQALRHSNNRPLQPLHGRIIVK